MLSQWLELDQKKFVTEEVKKFHNKIRYQKVKSRPLGGNGYSVHKVIPISALALANQ